jgi:hypothetical protein
MATNIINKLVLMMKDRAQMLRLKDLFRKIDKNHDGGLCEAEFVVRAIVCSAL